MPATVGVSLGDLRWLDVRSLPPETLLVVPLGASEQHGPHLPLSTASDIVDALARTVAERRDDVVVAPLVAYGSSGEHGGFAGTLSVGHEAIELFLLALARAASATFSRLLFVCAHGGNAEPLRRVVHRLRAEGRDVVAFLPRWGPDAHAGGAETSLMLAIAPDRVRLDLAEPGATEAVHDLMPRLVAEGVRAVSPNGVLGDPRGASTEEGRLLLERAVDELEQLLDAWPVGT